MHGVLRWLTYVPRFDPAPRDPIELLRGSRRLAVERHIFHKVVVSRHLLATSDAMLSNGNHYVAPRPNAPSEESGPHARVRDAFAAIAHVPIRSGAQFIAKVAIMKLGRMAAGVDWAPDAGSQSAYETVRSGREVDAATLLQNAVNWSVFRDRWVPASSVELVDDPFLASIALKYTSPAAADPLPLVLAAIERIVRRLASGAPAPAPRPV